MKTNSTKTALNRRQFIRNGASALAGAALAPVAATEKWSRTGAVHTISTQNRSPGFYRFVLLTGDAIVFFHTSFEYPEWHFFGDIDREEAAKSRKRLLDRATTDEMFIHGFHFPFPGLGHAIRDGDAYRWHPAWWTS